jgi:signal transduction histidine kinase/CheY-like chemotaxis protein
MARCFSLRAQLVPAGRILALGALYVLLARLSPALIPMGGFATLVWPASGASLAALMLGGYRLWPGIALGALVTELWLGAPALVALGIAAGNTLEAVVGAFALHRIPGFRSSLDRFIDVLGLALLAGVASSMVGATIGTLSLALGRSPGLPVARTWLVWWLGDLIGVLLLAPLVLSWTRGRRPDQRRRDVAPAVALGAFLVGGSALLFSRPTSTPWIYIVGPYVLFLPLLGLSLCCGVRGAATGMFLLAIAALWGTATGHGTFARGDLLSSLSALHIYLFTASLASLILGAVVSEGERSRESLRESEERQRLASFELLQREQSARVEAEAATRAKDEFLAVLSHELRTPLQSMLGWTQILRERHREDRALQKGLLTIERNVRTQAQLIEDLLDVSRIVAGKLRLERGRIDLGDVVASAVESARSAADARSIHIDTTLEDVGGEVLGDPDRLQQVVSNLLSNAVKFTPQGGRIGVRMEREGARVRIVVEDTGPGIPPELLPHVFERFRQAECPTRRAHGGLGLGLSIVHHLVDLHGGTVKAESPGDGRGAVFTVTLPLISVRSAITLDRRMARSLAPSGSAALDGVRVLVVDDDPDARELLETALREAGASVRAVSSVQAALEALESFHPDLLLSDIGMPEEDGYALIRRLRARESAEGGHVPAVALTAFASQADREQALALGFEEHLTKPTSPCELSRTVARLLKRAA